MTVKELIRELSVLQDDAEVMVEIKYEADEIRVPAKDSYLTYTKNGQRYTLVGFQ